MKFIADIHIHSHFSIATSKNLTPEHLDYWAQLKGVDVVGTGDCAHPGWLEELKEKLKPAGNGLYRLKEKYKLKSPHVYLPKRCRRDVYFILTGEISSIYKKTGKVRKVHNVCVLPDFDSVDKLQLKLSKLGNIKSDGRPILGIDAKEILRMTLETSDMSYVIPAHIWTPWFSVLGAKSGFDNIEECYEDLTPHIFAVETGLSSDPPMNWACSFLDSFSLVSNSDAHSPEKLGREANLFNTEVSYSGIYKALKHKKGFLGTIEFFPQEGKYHYDGHRKCNTCWDPVRTINHGGVCPVCSKPVTKGVMYRVAELADRANIFESKNRKDFYSITSLISLIAEIEKTEPTSKKARKQYFELLDKVGPDFYTLLFAKPDEVRKKAGSLLATGIERMRNRQVNIQEGYDGEFGRITVFDKSEIEDRSYCSLFEQSREAATTAPAAVREPAKAYSIKFDIKAFKKIYRQTGAGNESQLFASKIGTTDRKKQKATLKQGNQAVAGQHQDKESLLRSEADQQEQAISHKEGVCMVIAGPGSGKTHVLTQRIIHLIEHGYVQPENILAITFSNKAAQEMRERIKAQNANVLVSTFHAFGHSVLKRHYKMFGRDEEFSIVDQRDRQELIEKFCLGKKKDSVLQIKQISRFKQGIFDDTPRKNNESGSQSDLFQAYNSILQKQNAFDLDDLIYLPVQLFRENPKITEKYRKQFKCILVDEYQDINPIQYELIRILAGDGNPNLFVIGDPDQAIYGFRGSDVRYIDKLKQDYTDVKIIQLPKSYRCPSPVLDIAGQVLQRREYLKGKPLDIKIDITQCQTDKSEADYIASQIEKMIGGTRSFSIDSGMSDGTEFDDIGSFSDFAILCRTSIMFEPVINSLKRHGIAYQVVGTEPFYLQEPFSSMISTFKMLCSASSDVQDQIQREIGQLIKKKQNVCDVLYKLSEIQHPDIDENDRKRFIDLGKPFRNDYNSFFKSLTIREGIDEFDTKREAVHVMTLHASKGLEFNVVFIPGCEDGIIPFELFGKKTAQELEEEERLLYVGVTRTKKRLILTHAQKRMFKGRALLQKKSRLLDRLQENLLRTQAQKTMKKKQDSQLQFSF